MSNNPLDLEPTYEVNTDFNVVKNETGAKALALRLQNLLLTEKGTYPNNFSLGVGISKYDFEFLDATTLADIRTTIKHQVSKWIPKSSSMIKNVLVENMNTYNISITNSIIVAFELGANADAKFIGIVLQKDTSTSRVTSEILIH
jgi:hypothetical protein